MNWKIALFLLPGLITGITFHEAAHAITASWLGDKNAKRMGRVTLNPFKHLSPLGTIALFALGFGWGKPVEVNLYNFSKPKFHYLLSSLAGPVANLILAAIALAILYLHPHLIVELLAKSIFYINVILAVVNLLPIPPLDGSKIWPCIIPKMKITGSNNWTTLWFAVLLLAFWTGAINKILVPVLGFIKLLLPTS